MLIRRPAAAITVVLALVGASARVVAAKADAGVSSPDANSRTSSPCPAIAARQKKLLQRIRRQNTWLERVPEAWGSCMATAAGAWAVVVDEKAAASKGEEPFAGRWMLLHVDRNGQLASVTPELPRVMSLLKSSGDTLPPGCKSSPCNFAFSAGSIDTSLSRPSVFDFDRDGEPELLLLAEVSQTEGSTESRSWLWTFKDGAITPYAPAAGLDIAAMDDADKDGAPDLVLMPYVGESDNNEAAFPEPVTGPSFLAHTLPDGSFSMTDAVAEAHAKNQCPSRPEKLIVMDRKRPVQGEERSLRNVVCARVWGASAEEARSAADAQCRKRRGACTDQFRKQLKDWVARKPPLTLGR